MIGRQRTRLSVSKSLVLLVPCALLAMGAFGWLGESRAADGDSSVAGAEDSTPESMSEPTGKVGLLPFNSVNGLPRASGMTGSIGGYIVSHPSLQGPLTVSHNGKKLPALGFDLEVKIINSSGIAGIERILGKGRLSIFFDPNGIDRAALDPSRAKFRQEIEDDDVSFEGELDWEIGTYLMRMSETVVASRPFRFRDRLMRTPVGRKANDILMVEYSSQLNGLALASTSAMGSTTPAATLEAISGASRY